MSLVRAPSVGDRLVEVLPASSGTSTKPSSIESPLPSSSSSLWCGEGYVRLEFTSWTDLATRLMMLPRIEEEGRGAVIASFTEPTEQTTLSSSTATSESNPEAQNGGSCPDSGVPSSSSQEHRDDVDGEEKEQSKQQQQSMEGHIFEGIESQNENWREQEFTYILTRLREETNSPLILVFSIPPIETKTTNHEEDGQEIRKDDNLPTKVEQIPSSSSLSSQPSNSTVVGGDPKVSKNQVPQDSLQAGMLALSSWGMRMRAQASEAATNLSTVAKTFQVPPKDQIMTSCQTQQQQERQCDIHMQTSVGAFVPISKAQSKVTTSSVLFVRKSATEAAPRLQWTFQWYRSSCVTEKSAEVASSQPGTNLTSTGGNPSITVTTAVVVPPINDQGMWIEVEGATTAAFQPDATLIGRRVRCIVTMKQSDDPAMSEDSYTSDDSDSDRSSSQDVEQTCEMSGVIWADSILFNGARQALVRGATFGGLKGRGNASGRVFRVEVSIGWVSRKRSRKTTSALHIFQMSGQESLPLTPTPILGAIPHVPEAIVKHVNLQIEVPPDSILSALCTDGFLELESPSRLARESLLMALGIASYQGTPASLDAKTILFPDESPSKLSSLMDDESSVSSTSVASGTPSHGSARKSSSSIPSPGFEISPIHTVATPTNSIPGTPDRSLSESPRPTNLAGMLEEQSLIAAMEQEIEFLRGKLARKDKVVNELQRQITQSDAAHETTRQSLASCRKELEQCKKEKDGVIQSLQKAEGCIQSNETKMKRSEADYTQKFSAMERTIESQSTKIVELEKSNKALQNERGVLKASIEARESKLTRMAELQSANEELTGKVVQVDTIRNELETSKKLYSEIQESLRRVEGVKKEREQELETAQKSIETLNIRVQEERTKAASCQAQVDPLQKMIQQVKGERNSYKQKTESLSKEISRLCKNGRTIKDIEKIVGDFHTLSDEVETLRKQKKKALEEAHQYRTSYEHSRAVQALSGIEGDTQVALERNAELVRVLAETTEYINAKEMQLETMRLVNEQLQDEIRNLAKAQLGSNDV